jgi:hypothetical protein
LSKIKDIHSFKLVECIRFKYRFNIDKSEKDEFTNILTSSKLIAQNDILIPKNNVIKSK